MKREYKLFLKTFMICSFICVFLVGVGYFYLNRTSQKVNSSPQNIPYYQTYPESKGILFSLGGSNTFIYLDFSDRKLTVSLTPEESFENQIYGYSHDYTINGDNNLAAFIIDNVGGINLTQNGEKLRFTGNQVCELLKRSDSVELRREIINGITANIAEYGVGDKFISDIINNCETKLKYSECYFWDDYLQDICKNVNYID